MKKQNADKEAFKKTLDEITRETGYDFDIAHKEFAYIAAVNYHKRHTNKLNKAMTPTYEEWLKIYYSEAKQVTIRRGLHDNVWRTESALKKRYKKAYKNTQP